MNGKNVKVAKRVIPGIVVACMLFGNMGGALAFGDTGYDVSVLYGNETTVNVIDQNGNIAEINNTSASAPLYLQTNFKEMRRKIDTQFETATSVIGTKFGPLYKDKNGADKLSPSYFEALGNKQTQALYAERVNEVKNIANDTFTDVDNSKWYCQHIPLAVYYTVLNGYDDMSFKGDNNVTVAEISKIMAVALEGTEIDTKEVSLKGLGTNWFNCYFDMVGKVLPYSTSTDVTVAYMNSNMKRAEIAYTIAKIYDNGRNELQSYIDKANTGNVDGYFNDMSSASVTGSDGTLNNEQWHMNEGRLPARFAGAIMYLKDKGIMMGDNLGNCNALNGVTRAEAIALTERIALKGVNYTRGQFKGTNPVDTGTGSGSGSGVDSGYIYSMDTILNPEADAKYQYKIGDLRPSYGYKALMQGKEELHQVTPGRDYSRRVVEEVKDSVKYENGVISFYLPDIKSEYHEVIVRYTGEYTNYSKVGPTKAWRSSKDHGNISLNVTPTDWQNELFILVRGMDGKGSAPASYTYAVKLDFVTGAVRVREN